MPDQYRVTLHDPTDAQVLSGDPDEVYWTLDGLTPADNPTARIESITTPGRFIEATARNDASLVIRYRERATAGVHQVDAADILAAHQAIMTCLRGAPAWRAALDPISGSSGTAGPRIDYRQTGLSIATAMLDDAKRRQRGHAPKVIPPTILWGSRTVTTGDTWNGVAGSGRVAVRFPRPDRVHEHGVALLAAGGTLRAGPAQPARETVIWPTADNAEIVVDYIAPTHTLQVCNVYLVPIRNGTATRVDRWSRNAGMLIEPVSELERIYHCNHASTAPPAFADLTFSIRLLPGP